MKPSQVLLKARALIERLHRWWVGDFTDPSGKRLCAGGALNVAAGEAVDAPGWDCIPAHYLDCAAAVIGGETNPKIAHVSDRLGRGAVMSMYDVALSMACSDEAVLS